MEAEPVGRAVRLQRYQESHRLFGLAYIFGQFPPWLPDCGPVVDEDDGAVVDELVEDPLFDELWLVAAYAAAVPPPRSAPVRVRPTRTRRSPCDI
jgi:hypothetical protein